MALEKIDQCPLCNHTPLVPLYECVDHTSSQEIFTLTQCPSCSFLLTNPRPDIQSLPDYYRSKTYVSHSGQSIGPINFIYLLVRRLTIQWKLRLIERSARHPSFLDYGCGTGELLAAAAKKGWTISGLEPSLEARQKAEKLTGIKIASTIEQLTPALYDVITLWHVLEHIADFKQKISHLKRLLNTNGVMLIAVPNYESEDARHYKTHWAAFDVPRHLWHFSKRTMAVFLTAENLKIQSILPMKLDSYYVSMLSEKYKHPGQNPVATIIRGAIHAYRSNTHARRSMNYSSLIYVVTP